MYRYDEFDAAFVHVDDVFGGAEAVGDGVHGDGGLSGWGRWAGGEEGIGPVGGDAAERGHGGILSEDGSGS